MSRRKRQIQDHMQADGEASFELDLSPMLSLMVCLIPIMLLATVFLKVTIVETDIPQVVEKAIEEDRKKKDRDILIKVVMMKDTGFQLKVTIDGKSAKNVTIPKKQEQWDLDSLHQQLVQVKQQFPKIFRLDLTPAPDIKYDEIIKVIDEARSLKSDDPKVYLENEENKKVAIDVMFPDVVFGNVIEG
ncbi:MAG: biopolymer transporter ExbD [Bdellovibrionales bacterium]|nr:biopolymer transporter ExbD [Bdellovibrionales bacterium]